MATDEFAFALRFVRKAKRMSQKSLAESAELSESYVSNLETGRQKNPSATCICALARALGCDDQVTGNWLRMIGSARVAAQVDSDRFARRVNAELNGLLKIPATYHSIGSVLIEAIQVLKASLNRRIRAVVIPFAGSRHLALATHFQLDILLRSISEAARAGLTQITLVLAPETEHQLLPPLTRAAEIMVVPNVTISHVRQAGPSGLGAAVLLARDFVGDNPFVVLLPDDVLGWKSGLSEINEMTLAKMIAAYPELEPTHLFAARIRFNASQARGGFASLGWHARSCTREAGVPVLTYDVNRLIENPDAEGRGLLKEDRLAGYQIAQIIGRYVLSPTIFGALEETVARGRNSRTQSIELTDALETHRRLTMPITAYIVEESVSRSRLA